MKASKFTKSTRKRHVGFNPTRTFIEKCVEEYLDRGGRITRLKVENSQYNMNAIEGSLLETDDYSSNKFDVTKYQAD